MQLAAVGAASGVAATAVMSGVMVGARETGLMSEIPPHEIASNAVDRTPARDEADAEERRSIGWLSHFAFGAGAGAIYALLRNVVRTPGPATLHGAGYALAIWLVSYLGWIPALSLLPPADRDEPGRQPAMVAAHLVFGAVLGALVQSRLPRRPPKAIDAAD
jgi:hypothetical protein